MYVVQLFKPLLFTPSIHVIESPLPNTISGMRVIARQKRVAQRGGAPTKIR